MAAAVGGIKQAVTPRELCSALGVCDSSLQLQGPVDCPICKMIVVTLIAIDSSSAVEVLVVSPR